MAKEFFNTDELVQLLDDHYTGKHNYARNIWTVYVFLVWYNKFFIELNESDSPRSEMDNKLITTAS